MTISRIRVALVFLLIQASMVYGEIYQCRSSGGRVEFSNSPCPAGSVTERVSETASPTSQSGMPVQTKNQNVYQKTLDRMVDEAIGTGDLRRAKELALTPEHWSKIRAAETPKQKTSAEIQAEQSSSEECRQAKRSYELEAGSAKQGKELIDAKKRSMYSACGMREPNSIDINNTVNVNR